MYSMNLGDPQILKAPWLLHFADLQRFSLQLILNATKSKICVEPPTEKHKNMLRLRGEGKMKCTKKGDMLYHLSIAVNEAG